MSQEVAKDEKGSPTIVVTGGNKGIGLEICKMLCSENCFVILCARQLDYVPKPEKDNRKNPDKYECEDDNKEELTRLQMLQNKFAKYKKNNIDFVELDITNEDSINKCVEYIKDKYGKIDVLVNNAGMAFKGDSFDLNVVNTTFVTNYYGTINCTKAFIPIIKNNGRIIFLSSSVSHWSLKQCAENIQKSFLKEDLTLDELNNLMQDYVNNVAKYNQDIKQAGYPKSAYGMSKIGVSMYSRILSKNNKNFFIVSYCPGYCQTSMTSGNGQRTANDGAKGIALLCLKKNLKSGHFYTVNLDNGPKLEIHGDWIGSNISLVD